MTVMRRAWEIAREGQARFGGSAKEYIAAALQMAWVEVKTPQYITVTVEVNQRRGKTWVARITGKDARWGFAREFVSEFSSDADGDNIYHLVDGAYEICDCGNRRYMEIIGDKCYRSDKREVARSIA